MKQIKYIFFVFIILFKYENSLCQMPEFNYVIITPSIFVNTSTQWDKKLVTFQKDRGFDVILITVSNNASTTDIKNIIDYYYSNCLSDKFYVLLIGSSKNFEYLNVTFDEINWYTQQGKISEVTNFAQGNYIPFWSVTSRNDWAEGGTCLVPSDDPYLEGLNFHGEPYIGRIPVESIQEIENYVNKLIIYYSNLQKNESFMRKELFVGRDVTDIRNGSRGTDVLKGLYSLNIPKAINFTSLLVSDYLDNGAFEYSELRANLFENKLNEGVALISMLSTSGGDLSGFYYSTDYCEFNFTNINKLSFLLATNCLVGNVNDTKWFGKCVMRELMVYPNGGIIGSIAPTEGTEQCANMHLMNYVHDLIYYKDYRNVGEIFKNMKQELRSKYPNYEFYYNGLTLFADPSMDLSIIKLGVKLDIKVFLQGAYR